MCQSALVNALQLQLKHKIHRLEFKMNRISKFTILNSAFIILFIALVFPLVVFAQDADPNTPTDDEVNAIAKEMYCPVCENVPLDVCGTQACADWREEIRTKLTEGWTKEQIQQYFVDRFGARVLAEPPARGLNWLVYVVPPIAFLAGVFILYRGIKSWRQIEPDIEGNQPVADDDDQPTDEYMARLEEELRRVEE